MKHGYPSYYELMFGRRHLRIRLALSLTFWVCCGALPCSVRAQDKSAPAAAQIIDPFWLWPFDRYKNISLSDEKARLENFANELKRQPEQVGYVIVYAGRRSCIGEARARAFWAKSFLVNECSIQPDRLVGMDGGYRESAELEMWLRPKQVGAPSLTPTIHSRDAQIVKDCRRKRRNRRR